MARQIKINQKMDLKSKEYLQEDIGGNNFFKVTGVPTELTAGKNYFKMRGGVSNLQSGAIIGVEVLDGAGEPIFCEPLDHYVEPNTGNRYITIWVYGHENPGLGSITMAAIATRRADGRPINGYWAGKYNTFFYTDINVQPDKMNTTPCLFLKVPRMAITQKDRLYLKPVSSSYEGSVTSTGSVAYEANDLTMPNNNSPYSAVLSINPQTSWEGADPSDVNFHPDFGHGVFNMDMVGGTITVDFTKVAHSTASFLENTTNYSAWSISQSLGGNKPLVKTFTINQVINFYQLGVSPHFEIDINQHRFHSQSGQVIDENIQDFKPPVIHSSAATASYQMATDFTTESMHREAFARVELADLEPAIGDVRSIKCYVKPQGFQTWELVEEKTLEAGELLSATDEYTLEQNLGTFIKDSIRTTYWEEIGSHAGVGATNPHLVRTSSLHHANGIVLSGSLLASAGQYISFSTKNKVNVFKDNEYVLSFRAISKGGSAAHTANPQLEVYLTGSAVGASTHEDGNEAETLITVDGLESSGSSLFKHFSDDPGNNASATIYSTWGDAFVTPIVPNDLTVQTLNQGFAEDGAGATPMPTQTGLIVDKTHLAYYFTPNLDGDWGVVFKVLQGDWYLGDISLKAVQQTGFSPNHTTFDLKMPTYQHNNVVDFRFDLYDNLSRPVLSLITSSFGFTGGTTAITHPSSSLESGATLTMENSNIDAQGFTFENFVDEDL
jgi:hypothetical protein